jgi:GNAT superfamily N-acetyltransferase
MLIKKLDKLVEKKKWMDRFRRAYSGELHPDSCNFYGNNAVFLVAYEQDRELGFIRINDKTSHFAELTDKIVWNLTDGYVKPPYRSKGVLKKLIKYSVEYHDVKMMYIETARFEAHLLYYHGLGFTHSYSVRGGDLTWAFQDEIWPEVKERNAKHTMPIQRRTTIF